MKRLERATGPNDRRYRNAVRVGLALSLAVHAALLFAWRSDVASRGASVAAGPRNGDPVAAAGGGAIRAIALAELRPVEIPAPPKPIPVLDAPDVDVSVPAERIAAAVSLDRPGTGGAQAGIAGGTGRGDGGADAEGRYRNTVPEPRVIIPDWDAPKEVKGLQVRLRVLVDERGRPVDVELDPRTPDEGFNRRLIQSAMEMEFKPALRDGRPVRDWAVITRVF